MSALTDPDWSINPAGEAGKRGQLTPAAEFRLRLNQLGWGQKRAATGLGVERNTIRSWQRWPGTRPPSSGMALALQVLRAHLALKAAVPWYSPMGIRDRRGLEELRTSIGETAQRCASTVGSVRDGADE